MEVTTVSPSPASPTEWEDLCETDVTNVAIHSVTLLVCLCGLVGNGAVLRLLKLKLPNTGIFDLAFTDFLFLIFTVPSALLLLVEDVSCSPIVPLLYLSFLFQLSVVSCYWALFQLIFSRNNSNMYKFCMFYCHCDIPERLLWLLYSVQYWVFFALFAVILAVANLCPSQEQGQCQQGLKSVYAVILILLAATMVIPSIIKFIKAKWSTLRQQPKRRDIVIFLLTVSIFLLCLCNFLQQLGHIISFSQFFFLRTCIHSSIKPFIYFVAGRCWSPCSMGSFRLSLQRVFDEQEEEAAHSNDASMDTEV
ncbi:hypothetical protein DUI87_25544 [Hirundo rustica rustica]|uniref:G-protein coupled receptors family 1 profile domain-containing protein n=1 Tax=Hirundo rustica rustica TaxID=333673 RepID=A0A3M0JT73_HIRRU|nr:hypothetical protein DUI87_25544 [Hirundo rustica rustica]